MEKIKVKYKLKQHEFKAGVGEVYLLSWFLIPILSALLIIRPFFLWLMFDDARRGTIGILHLTLSSILAFIFCFLIWIFIFIMMTKYLIARKDLKGGIR